MIAAAFPPIETAASPLPVLPVLIPLATALIAMMVCSRPALQRAVSLGGVSLFFVATLVLLSEVASSGTLRVSLGGWPAPFGIELVADPLGAGMLVITALMGLMTLIFQLGDANRAPQRPTLLPLTHALLAAVAGAFVTGDLFNLYVWFELMLVASLGLLAYRSGKRQLEGALKYFVLNTLGTLMLLLGIAFLHGVTGHLGFSALAESIAGQPTSTWLPFIVLIAIAFLVKAAAFPVFSWLPASYPSLPAPLLALFAGLLTKVGVYALLRLFADIAPVTPQAVFEGLGWVASATMLFGVIGAAYHWDMRRILSFHIVSQIGYMLLGIALASQAGQVGTIFYIIHHIIVKANLFLIAAIVYRQTGSYDLRETGGLYATRPALAMLFAIPALSLVGIPPLSGFWAKYLVLRETLAQGHAIFAAVALFTGLLTLYSMTKIWFGAFWRKHPDPNWAPPTDARLGFPYLATVGLAAVTLLFGLAPELLARFAELATFIEPARTAGVSP